MKNNKLKTDIKKQLNNDVVISLKNVSKIYKLYNSPKDRFKEALHPRKKKYHKDFFALKNINLEIKKSEILGIVGKNGCGKSTLLKVIAGVLGANSGRVNVKGKVSALLELGSGFNPEFTGLQNIFFYGTILGFSREEMKSKLDNILEFAEIGEFIHQPLKTYSSGMKSRLGFSVAVHIEPEILILDEVLSVGDVLFQRKCYAKMEEFFNSGKTILYVSHSANSVNELCNRAILLNEGGILLDSDAKTVTDTYQKMLFSSAQEKQNIIEALKNNTIYKTREKNKTRVKSHVTKNEDKNINAFLPGLKCKPNNVNSDIACFSNVQVFDSKMKKTNLLELNNEYKIVFDVLFKKNLKNVSVGVQIRNNKGVIISGINSYDFMKQIIEQVNEAESIRASVNFHCYLAPGIYILVVFMNDETGASSIQYDSYMFEVKKSEFKFGGYVSLNQTIETKKIDVQDYK